MEIVQTPEAPYYAVIFSAKHTNNNRGYQYAEDLIVKLIQKQDGYLGHENVAANGVSITVSYWRDLESIKTWRNNFDHTMVQKMGKEVWYEKYTVRICLVQRDYSYQKEVSE